MPAMRPRARFLEFFAANIRNKNTRMADYWAVYQLFAWCDRHRIAVDAVPVADSPIPADTHNLRDAMGVVGVRSVDPQCDTGKPDPRPPKPAEPEPISLV